MKKVLYYGCMLLYIPFYIAAFILLALTRLFMAIAYAGLLDFRRAKDVLRFMFDRFK